MVDKKQVETSKIDALYSWLSYDLQKIKSELLKEMKYSSVQVGSLYQQIKGDNAAANRAFGQELRYGYKQNQTIYDDLTAKVQNAAKDVLEKIDGASESISDSVAEKVKEVVPFLQDAVNEIKYGYVQQQAIYEGLTTLIEGEVVAKLDDMQAKLAMLEQIDATLTALQEKLAEGIALYEDNDYKAVIESVAEKTEESVALHSKQVLDAVAAIPVAENVDYNRIVDEVGDKVLEYLGEIVPQEKPKDVDYDKIAYGTAEKVVESLPYPEKVDYRRIDSLFMKAVETVQAQVSEEAIEKAVTSAVEKVLAAFDVDALAAKVAEKIVLPEPAAVAVPEIDYDRLADMVAEKISINPDQTYDVVLDETGISQIAEKVAEKLNVVENTDYERIATIVEEKVNAKVCDEPTYELTVDEEGVKAIAKSVSEELCAKCATCQPAPAQAPVEEAVEVVEETTVEEVVEETVEVVEEQPVEEELAVAVAPEVIEPKHVDAAAGLVDRLNRSFTAKMKQSEEKVKKFYSDIKNALTSYKKLNSNVSWNGDRFNYGRDTVAKMLVRGKTLRLLLALDPEDPEFKETVYHQKNVSDQKAHESTPFMVKITSEMGVKKAVRLVTALAEKLAAEKDADFVPVDYVAEYAYEDDETLENAGYIKRTKEKKVDFNF